MLLFNEWPGKLEIINIENNANISLCIATGQLDGIFGVVLCRRGRALGTETVSTAKCECFSSKEVYSTFYSRTNLLQTPKVLTRKTKAMNMADIAS